MRLVTNGVDVDRFAGAVPREPRGATPRVLFVGGLTTRKGILDLGAASEALRERGVGHELWIAGGVPDEGDEAHDGVLRDLPSDARLLGAVAPEDVAAVYASCDVFCLPSWWEAMPLTVLEAQARPVCRWWPRPSATYPSWSRTASPAASCRRATSRRSP